jgi:hypothetical protein
VSCATEYIWSNYRMAGGRTGKDAEGNGLDPLAGIVPAFTFLS